MSNNKKRCNVEGCGRPLTNQTARKRGTCYTCELIRLQKEAEE
jgi:hypothetical protein